MPQPNTFQDYGCLWITEALDGWQGKIYGVSVVVKPDERPRQEGSKLPDFFLHSPGDLSKDMGALWWRSSSKDGTRYLTGKLKADGGSRNVSLWPVQQKSDRSPVWRVMPPRDEPQTAPHEPEDVDLDSVSF